MPLSWPEIKTRALLFSKEWEGEESEHAEAKSFLNDFFEVFGIKRRRVATFETHVKKIGGKDGYIDLLWKGKLLVEFKSARKDLDRAYAQATDYFPGIKERDLPRYILVCDFARFRLYDLDTDNQVEFALADLHNHIARFAFIAGYLSHEVVPQDHVNIKAAEQMGRLHDLLKESGYVGHSLEVLLVRLLFCLFAENTGIFQPVQSLREWIENFTAEDGSDLGRALAELFQALNTPTESRQIAQRESFMSFPFVNGKLFDETLPIAQFDSTMRETLLDCCALDWSTISPAIFGALFQSIMDAGARRNLGAHYTSEENILKVIRPLFLDGLWAEFVRIKGNRNRLLEFHKRLRALTFLDPACGCGNFLVITYRELRLLELDVLRTVHSGPGSRFLNIHQEIILDVDQFFGIEIEEFPAQIAQVALWLMDHQMNLKVSAEFGMYFARIPLKSTPHIVRDNALRIDWNEVCPSQSLSYIVSNPPFSGAMVMGDLQRRDMALVLSDLGGSGVLDYVSCWYWKAVKYIDKTTIRVGLVSTNSITQGEQVGLLWAPMMHRYHAKIDFAHRTFRWSNEAKGVAAVHCVIIGFGQTEPQGRSIFEYDTVQGEPHVVEAKNINAYLVDAPDVFLVNRKGPICRAPAMRFGSMPRDGGNLILSSDERALIIARHPEVAKWIRPYTGAEEFLNRGSRFCLWLLEANPSELRAMPAVMERLEAVRQYRLSSKAASTQRASATPGVFVQLAQPSSDYLLIPRVSSERRHYIPMAFVSKEVIANDQVLTIEGATLFHFGVLSSAMHMSWVRFTCGRLKSDYRYSKDVVYNNFPWPQIPSQKHESAIHDAASGVLDVRAGFGDSSLADLYDPLTMPRALRKAHSLLDHVVDVAYEKRRFSSDSERVAFLFALYGKYTSLLPTDSPTSSRRRTKVN